MVKNLPTTRRPGFDPWVGKIPWTKEWQPTPVFLPGEFHGQRSLVGYSPQGHKESDMTERLTRHNFQVKPLYLLSHSCRKTDSWQPHGRGPPSCQCVAGLHKDYDSILMGKIKSLVNNQTPPSLLSEQLCQRLVSNYGLTQLVCWDHQVEQDGD